MYCTHTHSHTHTYIHTHIHIQLHTYTYAYIHKCTHIVMRDKKNEGHKKVPLFKFLVKVTNNFFFYFVLYSNTSPFVLKIIFVIEICNVPSRPPSFFVQFIQTLHLNVIHYTSIMLLEVPLNVSLLNFGHLEERFILAYTHIFSIHTCFLILGQHNMCITVTSI